jgi:segregation and condensation protein B
MKLTYLLESILFWKNEPLSIKKLCLLSGSNEEEVSSALDELEALRKDTGIILLRKEDEVLLGTSKEASEVIETLQKEELSKELSKSALETLSIILYKGPLKRSEIDYIRGVNSQFIVRHLEARGLIERIEDPNDNRAYLYKPTFELFAHLGITKKEELPEHNTLQKDIESFVSGGEEKDEVTEDSITKI